MFGNGSKDEDNIEAERKRKRVGTIDLTPTWKGVLPLLLIGLENGTETGKRMAREDLVRMAEAADLWNASLPK